MRWISPLLGLLPTVLADAALAQNTYGLPPNPSMNSSPNPGNDEVVARRRLLDAGYTDIQGRALRAGRGRIGGREVRVDIDSRGHIREW